MKFHEVLASSQKEGAKCRCCLAHVSLIHVSKQHSIYDIILWHSNTYEMLQLHPAPTCICGDKEVPPLYIEGSLSGGAAWSRRMLSHTSSFYITSHIIHPPLTCGSLFLNLNQIVPLKLTKTQTLWPSLGMMWHQQIICQMCVSFLHYLINI